MNNKRIITWLFACLPLVITIIVLPYLPAEVPAHYGFDGEVTRYGSKYEELLLPIFTILFGFFWLLMEKIQKHEQNKKSLFWANISTSLLFTVMTSLFLYTSFTQAENIYNMDIDFMKIIAVCLSIFWAIFGLIMPKLKKNWLAGIRTPWTLKSEDCWNKTHQFGGRLCLISGIIFTLLCLFVFNGLTALYCSLGSFLVIAIVLVIYSYHVYASEKKEKDSV